MKIRIVSHRLIGTNTHYVGGRTQPCLGGTHCRTCLAGALPRWLGYVAGSNLDGSGKGLLEISLGAADVVFAHQKQYGTIRGAVLELKRVSKKPNARLKALIHTDGCDPQFLVPEPDVRKMLERMWEIRQDRGFPIKLADAPGKEGDRGDEPGIAGKVGA